jgi:galactose mutarotase-like enzyme
MSTLSRLVAPVIVGALATLVGCASPTNHGKSDMNITSEPFGHIDGHEIRLYTLANRNGMVAQVTNYGATLTELLVPDRNGSVADVVLGFDTLEGYVGHGHYFGCMAGRCANRIAKGRFELDGESYSLAVNNGPNHLHGGLKGFDKVVWGAQPMEVDDGQAIRLTYHSPDGEEGYPGAVDVSVVYTLTNDDALRIVTTATTNAATPFNVVHHSYWNLGGHDSGDILDHRLTINAARYTPADDSLIPTGGIAPVDGTPYDFRSPATINAHISDIPRINPDDPEGYDLNYVVDGRPDAVRLAARVTDPASGRTMEIWANQPGIQFYSGNWISGVAGKGGETYDSHAGLCLESQIFPDAINKQGVPGWPSVVLRSGEHYEHIMVHKFKAE